MRSLDSSKLTKKSSGTGKLMSDKSVKQYIYGDFNDGFKLYSWIVESYVKIPNYHIVDAIPWSYVDLVAGSH